MPDLPAQKLAAELLSDVELEKQYKLEYGEVASYVADTFADLWRCKCGAVNRSREVNCHVCGTEKDSALAFDLEQLKNSCQVRLEEEREEAERKLAQSDLRKKKAIKVGIFCCILAAAVYFITTVVVPRIELRNELDQAVSFLDNEDYLSAESILDKLADEDFLDAAKYKQAVSFFDKGKYIQAITLFKKIPEFKDSAEQLEKSVCAAAEPFYQQGDYLSCIQLCDDLKIYPEVYYTSCYYRAVDLQEADQYPSAIALLEICCGNLKSDELNQSCEKMLNYMKAIRHMEKGNLAAAIDAFEKLGNYESSSEYLSLCKSCEKYCSSWEGKRSKYYNKNTKETVEYSPNCKSVVITVAPQRNGVILYKVNGDYATLEGDVLSDGNYTFNLSTGVGRLSSGFETFETIYEKVQG